MMPGLGGGGGGLPGKLGEDDDQNTLEQRFQAKRAEEAQIAAGGPETDRSANGPPDGWNRVPSRMQGMRSLSR